MTTTPRRAPHPRGGTGVRVTMRNTLLAYAFMLPFLVLLVLYHTWPVFFGTYLAFTKYNIISPPEWVGLENFRTLAADAQFWSGLKNSLKYILVVPVIQLLAIAVAMLVNRPLRGIGFFRTAYYVPVVTSFAVV
ncbi:MAG: sugar ABC transporter permease, partial [Deinococcota bacterium]